MKTNELTGVALDWAVARITNPQWWEDGYMDDDPYAALDMDDGTTYNPSTDWAQGGPIIAREEISISREFAASRVEWAAWTPAPIRDDAEAFGYGPTPLIAAMRCLVASRFGDEIEIPEELNHV